MNLKALKNAIIETVEHYSEIWNNHEWYGLSRPQVAEYIYRYFGEIFRFNYYWELNDNL